MAGSLSSRHLQELAEEHSTSDQHLCHFSSCESSVQAELQEELQGLAARLAEAEAGGLSSSHLQQLAEERERSEYYEQALAVAEEELAQERQAAAAAQAQLAQVEQASPARLLPASAQPLVSEAPSQDSGGAQTQRVKQAGSCGGRRGACPGTTGCCSCTSGASSGRAGDSMIQPELHAGSRARTQRVLRAGSCGGRRGACSGTAGCCSCTGAACTSRAGNAVA